MTSDESSCDAGELPKHKLRVPRARRGGSKIWIGTRKGVFSMDVDPARQAFAEPKPHWLGSTVFHAVPDHRDRDSVLVGLRTPEGRPTVVMTHDGGRSWSECDDRPSFACEDPFEQDPLQDGDEVPRPPVQEPEPEHGPAPASAWDRTVNQVFSLAAGHDSEYGTWYAGTSPQGLFRSADRGRTWSPVAGLHDHAKFDAWTSPGVDATPDGPKLHSVLIDPRDAEHLLVSMSSGGVLESFDAGGTWSRLDGGLQGVVARDPHAVVMGVTNPDRLWMQSHFGVYRMDLEERIWERVGVPGGAREQLDAGFPIAVHPADPDVAWTVPMDGSDAWTRMPKDGRPTVLKTTDGGQSWTAHSVGFPKERCWWTVKRQCLAVDGYDPLGVYIGTSTGEVWFSRDEGNSWRCVARGLPHIYSVEVG